MAKMMISTINISTRSSTSIYILCAATLLLIFAPSHSNCSASSMHAGDVLNTGDSLVLDDCELKMGNDCDLVVYATTSSIWDSNTSGKGDNNCQAKLNNDGQLVIFSGAGKTVWGSSYQGPNSNYVLEFNGDCYIGIRDVNGGHTVWTTCPTDICTNP